MGTCAVCGDTFIGGVVKDLMGMDSGIEQFSVGFLEQTLYCHAPKCKDIIAEAFKAANGDPDALHDALPEGPLKKVLGEAIDKQEAGSSA